MRFRVDDPAAMESRQYYNIAHSFQEDITEQPSILVGGHLKEYQVWIPLITVFLIVIVQSLWTKLQPRFQVFCF